MGEPVEPVVKITRHPSRRPTFRRARRTAPVSLAIRYWRFTSWKNSLAQTAPGRIPVASFWNWTKWRTPGKEPTTPRITGRRAGAPAKK